MKQNKPELYSSRQMKDLMHSHMSGFGSPYGAFVTEVGLWSSDVIVYKWSDGFVEYEIKTSKADLLGEVKVARMAWRLDEYKIDHKLSHTKFEKHRHYAEQTRGEAFIPTKFYFSVTPEMADYAVKKLKGLPYGVWCNGKVIKPAKKLKAQTRVKDLVYMLTRACTERAYPYKGEIE